MCIIRSDQEGGDRGPLDRCPPDRGPPGMEPDGEMEVSYTNHEERICVTTICMHIQQYTYIYIYYTNITA